ncbi:hypothetical protein D3C75_865300 [compost metagenome]
MRGRALIIVAPEINPTPATVEFTVVDYRAEGAAIITVTVDSGFNAGDLTIIFKAVDGTRIIHAIPAAINLAIIDERRHRALVIDPRGAVIVG